MMLEAWEQGIGSVWVRLFDVKKVAKAFELPKHIKPICLLPVGYPSEQSVPYAPWHDVYRSIEDFTIEL
jgi:nitroreductase